MTTYNTGNPVPSADARDRYDNSQVFDELMNGAAPNSPDRLGVLRQSWAGMENSFNQFLANSGFESNHLIYVDGSPLVVDRPTQLIERGAFIYRVKMPSVFPLSLSGNWSTDSTLLVDVADASLRQELAASSDQTKGAAMVGYRESTVHGYLDERVSATSFGLKTGNSGALNAAAMQRACDASRNIYVPEGLFRCETFFPRPGTIISGCGEKSIIRQIVPAVFTLPGGSVSKHIGLVHVDSLSATTTHIGLILEDIQLLGNVAQDGFREHVHLVSLNGIRGVWLNRTWLTGFQGDAVFLGSGAGDDTERHNFDVFITKSVIDGINNDNRNALSVVDGVNVHFNQNVVRNCTRPNMPGAVDIEPMNRFETTRDIFVCDNVFENIGGTSGVMGYTANHLGMGGAFFFRPSNNIQFLRNTARDCANAGGTWGASVSTMAAGPNTPPLDMLIQGNKTYNGAAVGVAVGAGVVKHLDNQYTDTGLGMFLGLNVNGGIYMFETDRNVYTRTGKSNAAPSGYGIQISTISFLKIGKEEFIDCGKQDGTFGAPVYFVDGTSDHVSIKQIVTRNVTGKSTYSIKALFTHTFTPETNSFEGNLLGIAGNDFKWKAGMYSPYTLATTFQELPEGVSFFMINGDTLFNIRSMVKTEKFRDPSDGSYASSVIQYVTPTSASGEQHNIYFRKPDPVTGGWGPLKKLGGI